MLSLVLTTSDSMPARTVCERGQQRRRVEQLLLATR